MTDDTTQTTTDTVSDSAPRATMAECSHTNPHTGRAFGDGMVFERGPAVAADGGERNAVSRDVQPADEEEEQTMRDVDHEHPDTDAVDANRVFQRGTEERADSE